jgi:hypothetical protein
MERRINVSSVTCPVIVQAYLRPPKLQRAHLFDGYALDTGGIAREVAEGGRNVRFASASAASSIEAAVVGTELPSLLVSARPSFETPRVPRGSSG